MTFRIAALHPVFAEDVVHAVVVGGKEFADGLTPVEEEVLGSLGTADDFSGEGRQPQS